MRLFWRPEPRWEHWLLIRRGRKRAAELGYHFVLAPAKTTLGELASVAGLRRTIEECFERAKGDLGLDHCEVRRGLPRRAMPLASERQVRLS